MMKWKFKFRNCGCRIAGWTEKLKVLLSVSNPEKAGLFAGDAATCSLKPIVLEDGHKLEQFI